MEATVVRLQRNIADYRMELRLNRTQSPAIPSRPTKRSGFTSTPPVPRFSGKSSWEQNRHGDALFSQVEVNQDLLSGQVLKSADPDEESGDQMSLNAVPHVDGDACHAEWRETVVADTEMEKFVLVPEACPVISMTSAAEPTFRPALSEEYSPVVLAGGGVLRHTPWRWWRQIQRECLSCWR